ncbi:2-deoxy-D-gluconate 3-dehydrogenase [Cellulomonas gelida]|uniref:2-deoxy-D-gluconate 3-dehydrogenase n=1 Tax=Cellulomonas gelida TaxID=1712 RepID=A0A4Y3KM48_9CELL|nr:2-deoxy-D-gluconate 3-dehydrogenase [Cellulomonas gelida]
MGWAWQGGSVSSTALVTGAGRGIGRGIAVGLARSGYDVALVGRTRAHLDETAAQVAQEAPDVRVVVAAADLVDATEVADAVARAEDRLGRIDLVVNNAGVIEHDETDFVSDDVEDSWRVVETNVRGPMLVAHAVLPAMLARGEGRLLQINSGSGYNRQTQYTGYGISKGALARLTTLLDAQYRDRGIRTLDLAPGVVATDMTAAMPVHADRTAWTSVDAVVALVRAFGDGELDALSGRFVRAGADTVASLRAAAAEIVRQDARRIRVPAYGPDDPLA